MAEVVLVSRWQEPGYLCGSATSLPSYRRATLAVNIVLPLALFSLKGSQKYQWCLSILACNLQTNQIHKRSCKFHKLKSNFTKIKSILISLSRSASISCIKSAKNQFKLAQYRVFARECRCRHYLWTIASVTWWFCFWSGDTLASSRDIDSS